MVSRSFRTRWCFRGRFCLSEECRRARNVKIIFFPPLSSCIQQNICLAPHRLIAQMLTAEGTLKWAFFFVVFCASGRKSGGREGVRDHDGFTNTRVDTQHTEILPGHLLRKSRILLSQQLHFLSGPGWVSNLLIAAVTTKWSSCESGNQLPRRVPPPLVSPLHVWHYGTFVFVYLPTRRTTCSRVSAIANRSLIRLLVSPVKLWQKKKNPLTSMSSFIYQLMEPLNVM